METPYNFLEFLNKRKICFLLTNNTYVIVVLTIFTDIRNILSPIICTQLQYILFPRKCTLVWYFTWQFKKTELSNINYQNKKGKNSFYLILHTNNIH